MSKKNNKDGGYIEFSLKVHDRDYTEKEIILDKCKIKEFGKRIKDVKDNDIIVNGFSNIDYLQYIELVFGNFDSYVDMEEKIKGVGKTGSLSINFYDKNNKLCAKKYSQIASIFLGEEDGDKAVIGNGKNVLIKSKLFITILN